ncbi:MAG: DUF3253 domain-containing protein [Alphaproteobacteria bacterium]
MMETDDKSKDAERKDDPIAETILSYLDALGPGKSASPMDIAKAIGEARAKPKDPPELWRRYMTSVKQQMIYLARSGRIDITRKGQKVDPNDFKGVVRLRLPDSDG